MHLFEYIGVILGLAQLICEFRVSIWLWPLSIAMPLCYILVYYNAGLYADVVICIYYVLAGAYGWMYWAVKGKNKSEHKISKIPNSKIYQLLIMMMLCMVVVIYLLNRYTDSNIVFWNSLAFSLSAIALWMLSRRYVEQWLVWVIVDLINCCIYFSKELYPTAILFGIYSVMALFGYMKWLKIMRTYELKVGSKISC